MAFPGTYNFSYYRGDTFEFSIYPKQSDGSAMSLDGYIVGFSISDARGAAGEAARISAYAEIVSDHVVCAITPADSDSLPQVSSLVYDVELRNDSATPYPLVHTILTGNISVTEHVGDATE